MSKVNHGGFNAAAKHETKLQGVHENYTPTTSLQGIVSDVKNPAYAPRGAAATTPSKVKTPTKSGTSGGKGVVIDSYSKQRGAKGGLHLGSKY